MPTFEPCKYLLFLIWGVHGYEVHHYWCDADHASLSWIDSITMYWLRCNIKNGSWGHILRHLRQFGRSKGEIPALHLAETRHLTLRQWSAEALHTADGKSSCLPLNDGASHSVPLFQARIKLLPSLLSSCTHLCGLLLPSLHPHGLQHITSSQCLISSSAVLNECSDSNPLLKLIYPTDDCRKCSHHFKIDSN